MDAIMDLTARAASFINFIQDVFLKASVQLEVTGAVMDNNELLVDEFTSNFREYIQIIKAKESNPENSIRSGGIARPFKIEYKIAEVVWIRAGSLSEENKQTAEQYMIELCKNLVDWLLNNRIAIIEKVKTFNLFSPHSIWREAISQIIYADVDQRVELAKALEYLPIHIVLALGGGHYDAGEQRILQWWKNDTTNTVIELNTTEKNLLQQFKKEVYNKYGNLQVSDITDAFIDKFYEERITYLLRHYKEISNQLLNSNAPLSFEYIFNDELDEIAKNRELREKELLLVSSNNNDVPVTITNNNDNQTATSEREDYDPFVKAKKMKLFAVAFSGGGIRSATFNLGILQGFAKKGLISKMDYLSTVSGGGYIGSWLATWIKRVGSVTKVTDRLNPEKSPDPLGEEVRAIRWLRMYSNYFTPNKSIMSIDSWTVGVTWLRNTLLNQVIIFSVLLSLLFLVRSSFELWNYERVWTTLFPGSYVYVTGSLFLLIIAFLTGIGMRWYNTGRPVLLPYNLNNNNSVSFIIAAVAIIGSYMISASLFFHSAPSFASKLQILWPAGIIILIVLYIIAVFGRYDKCIVSFGKSKGWAWFIIFYTAVFSAVIAVLSLAVGWTVIQAIKEAQFTRTGTYIEQEKEALVFTAGIPVIFLVFGITVVSRMAFLGRYFPDERREWWGRIGAVINRIGFIWILVSIAAATYLLRGYLDFLTHSWKAPIAVGSWMALVGGAVKAAFSSDTSGESESKGWQKIALDVLSKAGPYIFALGLLVFLPALVEPLIKQEIFPSFIEHRIYLKSIVFAAIFFIPALYLSWRLGVNEFSMHHFYRNRLVRAYLGATRRKPSREKTANPFTGFDMLDDEKLSKFISSKGYYGPYPILNTALNASQFSDLSRQDRKAESFIFSPLYCGFDFSKVRSSANTLYKSYDYGYRPTGLYAYPNDKGPGIGTAMAISGAAVNPNQGYHSSPATAFLLTVFNVQMGWWIGNPRKGKWQQSDPDFGLAYIVDNLIGQTNTRNEFVCLSDGGHFDNMGLYELVRRRCAFIILGDGEQDEQFTCEGFANAIRRCRIDFGAEITIDIDDIVKRKERLSKNHYTIGQIRYSGDEKATGVLIYIKSSINGDEPVDVTEYALKNTTFPHQTTADQFFDEEQFESYRKLGMHIADKVLADDKVISALNLKFDAQREDGSLLNGIEKPIKSLFNTLKDFFTKS